MSINKRQRKSIIAHVRSEDTAGVRVDAGPHIGIVQHVLDPVRTGRLQVWIPFLGGDPSLEENQRVVQYASPYAGYTNFQEGANNFYNETTSFETVRHTYGMWFTPPDVGVRVLVTFINGNPNNGFWFACIPTAAEHSMMGSSGGSNVLDLVPDAQVAALIAGYGTSFAPGVEFNGAATNLDISRSPKAPHRIQTKILANQGLLADPTRGIDDATTQRESPSGAFGITTPGRPYADEVTDDLLQQTGVELNANNLREKIKHGRKGGHQFIMDDGDVIGSQRRVKIRSAAGHQIVMDDTEGMIYISNSTGTNWIELTNDGQMMIYSGSDISVRTGGNLNVKVDGDYNTEVNGNYNLKVRGNVKTEMVNKEEVVTGECDVSIAKTFSLTAGVDIAMAAGAEIGLKSGTSMNIDSGASSGWKAGGDLNFEAPAIGLNSGPPDPPVAPTVPVAFTLVDLNDTVKNGDIWQHLVTSPSTAQTILPKITTHEPYDSRVIIPLVSVTGKPSRGPEPQA